MTVEDLANGMVYIMDSEQYHIVIDTDRDCSDPEAIPIVVRYIAKNGLVWHQESWVNTTIDDSRGELLRFLCKHVKYLSEQRRSSRSRTDT